MEQGETPRTIHQWVFEHGALHCDLRKGGHIRIQLGLGLDDSQQDRLIRVSIRLAGDGEEIAWWRGSTIRNWRAAQKETTKGEKGEHTFVDGSAQFRKEGAQVIFQQFLSVFLTLLHLAP